MRHHRRNARDRFLHMLAERIGHNRQPPAEFLTPRLDLFYFGIICSLTVCTDIHIKIIRQIKGGQLIFWGIDAE